jgi:hypothetical protein
MIVLLRASELAKGETESDWSDSPMIAEIAALADQAFSDDPAEIEPARQVLFALRQFEASDAADDREEGIRQSEAILRHVDAARFPVTAAGAHLKLGGALPKLSGSDDGAPPAIWSTRWRCCRTRRRTCGRWPATTQPWPLASCGDRAMNGTMTTTTGARPSITAWRRSPRWTGVSSPATGAH